MKQPEKQSDRKKIPSHVSKAVLNEFNYMCAICGTQGPQLHHIDEDQNNNRSENLLPLCPNCHLRDPHNPTAPIDPRRLSLFRRFKDPSILASQFEPLLKRMVFLYELPRIEAFDCDKAGDQADELIDFVSHLAMGDFYCNKLRDLLARPKRQSGLSNDDKEAMQNRAAEVSKAYLKRLESHFDLAKELVIEMLRYQGWHGPKRISAS